MKLFVLFGQRKEQYDGQYGLEALACMTEYDVDNNSEYLSEEKNKYDNTNEFERTEIIAMKVNEMALLEVMRPYNKVISADVV